VAIYVIAALVVLAFLFGAYRMMGSGATLEEDPRAVLVAVLSTATEAAQALDGTPISGDETGSPHAVRRRLDGCAQALERVAGIPVNPTLDEARTMLELAVDELTWSARLAEAPAYARDEALRTAGISLRSRGAANLEHARSQLDG
jgi:type VI protein secretion system component VasF